MIGQLVAESLDGDIDSREEIDLWLPQYKQRDVPTKQTSEKWVHAASLVVRKGATLESSFPPLLAHGVYGTGP